ncbi:MAG: hypothetical protein INR62_01195 [Rhodospirillales bacterium]|nr:hypothetical protein [Acetobacter sp.]
MRVDVSSRTNVADGRSFGDAGAYERLTGRIFFSVPVANKHNTVIVDLAHAVNLRNGSVEFSADFVAVRPKEGSKGNGTLLLEVPNRGHSALIHLIDGGTEDVTDPGNAWLLRGGYTVVSVGWQWDAPGADALHLQAPIAKENGKSITGLLRGDLMPSSVMAEIPLGHWITGRIGGTEYPVSDPDDKRNVLTARASRDAHRAVIPRSQWQFAQTVNGHVVPDDRHIRLNGGFQPGTLYEYVYVVKDPVVAGLGFAAIRDFASYAKHQPNALTPAKRVVGQGISQNGRFLRDFLYEGFNADENGQPALDGVLAHVAGAGRGSFNYRFAQPSRDAQPTSSVDFPTDVFPFTDQPETDGLTGEHAGLLDRARAEHVVPKIFFSNTSYEYWGRAAAAIHTSPDGQKDMALGDNVRVYKFNGLQHFSGPFPPARGKGDLLGQEPQSPLPVQYFWRAMIANMDAWVRNDTAPPRSRYPKLADGSLVPFERYHFPALPGVRTPHEASAATRLDFGPHWTETRILSQEPPREDPSYPVLVPQADKDGNDMGDGVRLPELLVPLATYAGWNLRDPSIGAPSERLPFEGSFLPFPKTEADRIRTQDPRSSIAQRYRDRADYLRRYTVALDELVKERWILPEDRAALLAHANQEWTEATR